MAIKIEFDSVHNPDLPVLILAKRDGTKIGQIPCVNVSLTDNYNDASEIQFDVYKRMSSVEAVNDQAYAGTFQLGVSILGNTKTSYSNFDIWDDITDFRLVWCKNWDMWFQIAVEIAEDDTSKKTVSCTQLGQAELSQIMLFNIEINTEDDIAREDYVEPTIFWNPSHKECSLLHRLMENAPHYEVIHVDGTLENLQRTFTFDDVSIYDAFQEIAEEIGCLFIFNSNSDSDGNIARTISVYDLYSNCVDCGYRGEFTTSCPKCGSTDINEGYGNDTTIFVSVDSLAEDITYAVDVDSVKNCFKLEAGDDLMTATIRNCNPNGSDRIWRWNSSTMGDMSDELVQKLNEYDVLYEYYQNDYVCSGVPQSIVNTYNSYVDTYLEYNPKLEKIDYPIVGYPALMQAYYDAIDMALYLQTGLMPTVEMESTTASAQAALLTAGALSPVAVTNLSSLSLATANNAVLQMAKCIVRSNYQVKVNSSTLSNKTWRGNFTVTNYANDEDTATSSTISVTINDDYETYLRQCITRTINSEEADDYSLSSLFNMDYNGFCAALKEYSLDYLTIIHDATEACLDVLIEQGVADKETWSSGNPNLYDDLYLPYYEKLGAVEAEMKVRQEQVNNVQGALADDGTVSIYGLETYIEEENSKIHDALDLQVYLGDTLWKELSSFRREMKYTNSNYISDGLDNAEIFINALDFIEVAEVELYKSSELQHSITSTLTDLLAMKEFEPLVDYFEVGNWIRILVDDNVYKLRLIQYGIDYSDLTSITVEFADVIKVPGGLTDVQSILEQASSMSTSYTFTQRQASKGEDSHRFVENWVTNGLALTSTKIINSADNQDQYWDEHGMLLRKYNVITDDYEDIQMKIVNSTIAITDDNWRTIRTAVGNFYYVDPVTGEILNAYGVNAETLVGKLILGEELGIYTLDNSMTFDSRGLIIDVASGNAFTIKNGDKELVYIDSSGNACFVGNISATSGTIAGFTIYGNALVSTSVVSGETVCVSPEFIALGARNVTFDSAGNVNIPTNKDAKFIVYKDGTLYAEEADITGTIYATDSYLSGKVEATDGFFYGTIVAGQGHIGDWDITEFCLCNGCDSIYSNVQGSYLSALDGFRQVGSDGTYTNIEGGKITSCDVSIVGQFMSWESTTPYEGIGVAVNGNYIEWEENSYNNPIGIIQFVESNSARSIWTLHSALAHQRYYGLDGYIDGLNIFCYTDRYVSIGGRDQWQYMMADDGRFTFYDRNASGNLTGTSTTVYATHIFWGDVNLWNGSLSFGTVASISSSGVISATSASLSGSLTVDGMATIWGITNLENEVYVGSSLSVSGDTNMSGKLVVTASTAQITVNNPNNDTDTRIVANSSWSNRSIFFGVGSDGKNRGIYDLYMDRWLIYAGEDNHTYINGATYVSNLGVTGLDGVTLYFGANGVPSTPEGLEEAGYGVGLYDSSSDKYFIWRSQKSGNVCLCSPEGKLYVGAIEGWSGYTYLGSSTGTAYLQGATIYIKGYEYTVSDMAVKTNIAELPEYDADALDAITPVSFSYVGDNRIKLGYLAQDVQAAIPWYDIVVADDEGTLYMDYTQIIPLLHLKIKRQDEEIQTLIDRVEELETALLKSE